MSEPSQPPPQQPGPPPGWYPNPAGPPRLRWWDGAVWTAHLSGPPAYPQPAQHQPAPVPQAPRPTLDAQTPIYNHMIWLIVLLPVLVMPLQLLWNPVVRFVPIGPRHTPVMDPASYLTPAYFLLLACALVVYGASVVLAYLDWRWLGRAGVVRPFHWAWAFLSATVYIIGRSVIVHKAAPGRGLAPIWTLIVVVLASLIIVSVKMAALFSTIVTTLPT